MKFVYLLAVALLLTTTLSLVRADNITYLSPTNGSVVYGNNINLVASTDINNSSINDFGFVLNGVLYSNYPNSNNNYQSVSVIPQQGLNDYYVSIYLNNGTTENGSDVLFVANPNINYLSPINNTVFYGNNIKLNSSTDIPESFISDFGVSMDGILYSNNAGSVNQTSVPVSVSDGLHSYYSSIYLNNNQTVNGSTNYFFMNPTFSYITPINNQVLNKNNIFLSAFTNIPNYFISDFGFYLDSVIYSTGVSDINSTSVPVSLADGSYEYNASLYLFSGQIVNESDILFNINTPVSSSSQSSSSGGGGPPLSFFTGQNSSNSLVVTNQSNINSSIVATNQTTNAQNTTNTSSQGTESSSSTTMWIIIVAAILVILLIILALANRNKDDEIETEPKE